MDIIGDFMAERCVILSLARVESSVLYTSYLDWCERNKERPLTRKALATRLQERGLVNERSSTTGRILWHGISLQTLSQDHD
jgi:putative DNA primase/helicase